METTMRMHLKRNDDGLKHDVAQGLVALRKTRGWTRKELAELLFDVNQSSLAVWESCARLPKGMQLLRVVRLLGLNLRAYPTDAVRASGVLSAQRRAQLAGMPSKPVIDLSALIALERIRLGLSSKDLAEHWGVSQKSLRNWEDGVMPTRHNTEKVAGLLGLPASAIGVI